MNRSGDLVLLRDETDELTASGVTFDNFYWSVLITMGL